MQKDPGAQRPRRRGGASVAGVGLAAALAGAVLVAPAAHASGVLGPVTAAVPVALTTTLPAAVSPVGTTAGPVTVTGGGTQGTSVGVGGVVTVTAGGSSSNTGSKTGVVVTTGTAPSASSPGGVPSTGGVPSPGGVPSTDGVPSADATSTGGATSTGTTTTAGASGASGASGATGATGAAGSTVAGAVGSGAAAASGAAAHVLSRMRLVSTAATVYPAVDGYKDRALFTLDTDAADGTPVAVTGKAVLKLAKKTVKTWTLKGANPSVTWNGRIGKKVKTGVYRLAVAAKSAGGSVEKAALTVRVAPDHLERRTARVRTSVDVASVTAKLPAAVDRAFPYGTVTSRIRTVASVHGPAKLVFVGNGVTRSLVLRDGTHTTKPLVVPKGFRTVRFVHRWAKSAATLKSFQVLWTYSKLVR